MATASDLDNIQQELDQHRALFNKLRLENASHDVLDIAKKKLGELQKSISVAKGASTNPKDHNKKRERLLLKTAKGTRDYAPAEMYCREHIERVVKECFTTYGGSCLDTPVFERKEILAGKYGEDAKLIFDLQDQGGEQLALRYDHTVPLARYLSMMGGTNTHAKLWQVGKVYRRDNPVMSKGRMREFSQADFDISGVWDPMIPDGEIISLVCTIFKKLDVGEFTVKLNNRKILDGIFEVCGVPSEKIRTISSAVDKLDKLPWLEVKKEMTDEKGLDPVVADRIGEYVKHKGGPELLEKLKADDCLNANKRAREGLADMELLFTLLGAYDVLGYISFDLSLARGLDYYTGIIYEVVVEGSAPPDFVESNASASADATGNSASTPRKKPGKKSKDPAGDEEEIDESQVGVGSIAAGGRYDGLVGLFSASAAAEGKKAQELPCVGVSIGLDRVFALLWPKWIEKGMRSNETMVYVMAAGDGLLQRRVELVKELRDAGIKADFMLKNKPKLPAQFAAGERDEVPFAIILGEDELKSGNVTVKEQKWALVDNKKVKVESADKGTQVPRAGLVEWLKKTPVLVEWSSGKWV